MYSAGKSPDIARLAGGTKPTPDALLIAMLEQQRTISEQRSEASRQSDIIEKKSSVISNQKARIAVLEELLAQAKLHRFGASSESDVLQSDLLFDEAELLNETTRLAVGQGWAWCIAYAAPEARRRSDRAEVHPDGTGGGLPVRGRGEMRL